MCRLLSLWALSPCWWAAAWASGWATGWQAGAVRHASTMWPSSTPRTGTSGSKTPDEPSTSNVVELSSARNGMPRPKRPE